MNTRNEANEISKTLLLIGKLKTIKRAGWISAGIKNPESTSEHSHRLAIMASILGKKLKLDELKMIKLALIEDAGEAIIGDLIVDGKHASTTREKQQKLEENAINEIFANIDNGKEYVALWKEFAEQKTREAKIVRELDKLEMAFSALEYEKAGFNPKKLDEFWETAKSYVKTKELIEILNEIEKMRN